MKHLVVNASLKTQHDKCILTPMQFYEWATNNMKGINFPENANASCVKFGLHKRYFFRSTVDGTVLKYEGSLLMNQAQKYNQKYNQSAVHSLLVVALSFVKSQLSFAQKVTYFSDVAASQYKSYKAFTNLCFHE